MATIFDATKFMGLNAYTQIHTQSQALKDWNRIYGSPVFIGSVDFSKSQTPEHVP